MLAGDLSGLAECPEVWRALVEAVPDLLLLVLPDGTIQYLNRAVPGVPREAVLGTRLFDYVDRELEVELGRSLAEIFAGGGARMREVKVTHPDGAVRWYATHTGPVLRDGRAVAATVVARDVSEWKRTESALRESEERNRTLVEHAPEAIVVFDMDACRFVDVNRKACALFGLSRDALLAADPIQLNPTTQPDGEPSHVAAFRHLAEAMGGATPAFDWTHRTPGGAELQCEVRLVRLPANGRRLVRGSVTDVTRQRQLEEHLRQGQKLEAVGQLAGGIAHDFNNLLTVILASAQVLEDDLPAGDPLRLETEWIRSAALRGSSLTGQLLSFARKKEIRKGRVELNGITESAVVLLGRLLGPDVRLVKRLDPCGAPVEADGSQLEQVLINLVLNARDAMPEGGTVTVSTTRMVERQWRDDSPCHGLGRVVRLRVEDDGFGMDEETQKQMFTPFFTTKPAGRGTGLGLAIVQSVVRKSGGCVEVSSSPRRGTTVDVFLPDADGN
jgi:PAS domain S-box-containing protein